MLNLASLERSLWHVWYAGQAPIVAALVAPAALLAGRLLRLPLLQVAAAGLALATGWVVALGGLALAPRLPADRLPLLALAGLAAGVASDLWRGGAGLLVVVLTVAAGWWLAGAPLSEAEAAPLLPRMGSIALAVLLAVRLLRAPPSPWVMPAGVLALWGGLVAAGAPVPWTGLALVPLAATLGQVAGPRGTWSARLPMAAGLAGLAALAVLAAARLPRGGATRIDLAALAPVLAVWLAPRLMSRLPCGGGILAALLAAAVAVGLAWGGGRVGLPR